jgi:hypothetical protein
MAESDFHKIKRELKANKIKFTTTGQAEPRFAIRGVLFTTQELIELEHKNNLTNVDLSEIMRTRRGT